MMHLTCIFNPPKKSLTHSGVVHLLCWFFGQIVLCGFAFCSTLVPCSKELNGSQQGDDCGACEAHIVQELFVVEGVEFCFQTTIIQSL